MITEKTRAEMREIIARYPQPRSALLPMLHLVQSEEGFVSPDGIEVCAELLDITAAEVAAVATFYTMYKRRPVGDYHVGVCTNTLCAVMGGDQIMAGLKDHLGIGNDETTEDGKVTLEHVECNAACDFAPVVMVNWEFFDNMTPDRARKLVDDLRAGVEVEADRGARVCTWRQAERVLAGFPDGRADEGPSAGEASLAGLRVAHERGWTAGGHAAAAAPDLTTRGSTPAEATRTAAETDTTRAESESRAAEAGVGRGGEGPSSRPETPNSGAENADNAGSAGSADGEKGQR
ncbi:NADH-quinone oxidoreductase subunit NuoE [Actinopolymorpha singaporensis]|uniref:NADH dehydrogenase subunit E n=1 Tax=Actinopolymorpha singaporensis TaxID=117157 RepID=A0A1H1QRZ3_9ACTN|nr:NADH-quinone oxidoreductase subunit NuoE [Actinopolymorpha singaporensis]SDS26248.1 NADH dehydrogenase subunit E [Actinopolymorpha singaporensis]